MNQQSSLFIVTGELSGDMHGAHLVRKLKTAQPLTIYAMGGQALADAGATLIVNSSDIAVTGFAEVVSKFKLIRQAFIKIRQAIQELQPKLVILIDYPGFNLRLAKAIKKVNPNLKIIYYISPQVWAWRYRRIFHLKKYVDLMTVILPFEVPIYQAIDMPVKFVGHPLVEQVKTSLSPSAARDFFQLKDHSPIIGLMPGSRVNEIKHLLPSIIKAAELLQRQFPRVQFLLPLAPSISKILLKPFLNKKLSLQIISQNHYDAIAACDALIVVSGTASLEVAMFNKPMVILYRSSTLSILIAKLLVTIKHIGLCNIIADKRIVKELIQFEVTPKNIAKEVSCLIEDQAYRKQIIADLQLMNLKLRNPSDQHSLAQLVLNLLSE